MSDSSNFSDILSTRADAVEKTPRIPVGRYRAIVKGFVEGKSTQKKTDYLEYTFLVVECLASASQDEAQAAIGKTGKEMKKTFYLTKKSLEILTDFIGDCGVVLGSKELRELIHSVIGEECAVNVGEEVGQNGKPYIKILSTGKL